MRVLVLLGVAMLVLAAAEVRAEKQKREPAISKYEVYPILRELMTAYTRIKAWRTRNAVKSGRSEDWVTEDDIIRSGPSTAGIGVTRWNIDPQKVHDVRDQFYPDRIGRWGTHAKSIEAAATRSRGAAAPYKAFMKELTLVDEHVRLEQRVVPPDRGEISTYYERFGNFILSKEGSDLERGKLIKHVRTATWLNARIGKLPPYLKALGTALISQIRKDGEAFGDTVYYIPASTLREFERHLGIEKEQR